MVAYQDFVALCRSGDSEDRGRAAHLAAQAYLGHSGPADEQAALYAALIGFLDDPSVKVRAALAYGLLHAREAPRPILLALLHDSPVISRAIAQYSPALIDADLISLVRRAEPNMLLAITRRERISGRLAAAMVEQGRRGITLRLLRRADVPFSPDLLSVLAAELGTTDPQVRGALFKRAELPAAARLRLVEVVAAALRETRIVRGAIAPRRLERLLRDTTDTAMTAIGEREASAGEVRYAAGLVAEARISARVMLHAIVNGHVLFLAECLAELAETTREKVFTLLESGGRPALNALLARCGLPESVRNLVSRLIFHARSADLADDVAARHFVVTALTEELIVEHEGVIPPDLEDAFSYLSEQNVALARRAARGVMSAFADDVHGKGTARMPVLPEEEQRLALPAA
jgi:uncharacterized protein (DUF2336 family)